MRSRSILLLLSAALVVPAMRAQAAPAAQFAATHSTGVETAGGASVDTQGDDPITTIRASVQ